MNPWRLLALACVILPASALKAQEDVGYDISPFANFETVQFHLSGSVALPLGELREAIHNGFGNVGVGLSTGLLLSPFGNRKPSPLFLGGDFSYHTYGVDKIDETATAPPLKSTFNIYTVNAAARMMLTQGQAFAPFIDGMAGMKIYNTRTKIDKTLLDTFLNDDQPEVLSTTNDTGLNYVLGAGFFMRKPRAEGEVAGSITVRVLYFFGDEVDYVKRDSIQVDNGYVTYESGRTRTDMLTVQLGFVLF